MTRAASPAAFQLTRRQRLAYSIGHVQNDLCSSMWFTYLLVFLRNVVRFSNSGAGYLLLWGQVVDALCTPIIGYASDKMHGFCGYGKRKSWHAIGTLCVIFSFPFLFMRPPASDINQSAMMNPLPSSTSRQSESSRMFVSINKLMETSEMLYYAFFVAVFQFGWAATQVAHLSLIPQLTSVDSERVELNAVRNAFTVLSSVTIYGSAWLIFSMNDVTNHDDMATVTDSYASEFRHLMMICMIIGIIFSFLFHFGTTEHRTGSESLVSLGNSSTIGCLDWLKEYQFYLIAIMYMCSRLIVNVSQTYWPLYLTDSLRLSKNFIAIVPLVVFSSGFVTSFLMRPLNAVMGRKAVCLVGLFITIVSCAAMWFISEANAILVLLPAVLLGSGGSILLITSLSMTADLIGKHTECSAFVFGAMSFTDKLSSGVCIALIQVFHPCKSSDCCPDCVWYYRNTMVLLPTAIAIISVCILIIMMPMKLGRLRWLPRYSHVVMS